ncbi:hypothetical protein OSTOST_13461 [Ostertagia ostertagi]
MYTKAQCGSSSWSYRCIRAVTRQETSRSCLMCTITRPSAHSATPGTKRIAGVLRYATEVIQKNEKAFDSVCGRYW